MKKVWILCAVLITAPSFANKPVNKGAQPPQLWTGSKRIDGSVEACALKAEQTLNSIGFVQVTKSVYETETYFYGNLGNNRAGIHCTKVAGRTFVFGSVAGSDVKTVEALRNKIFWVF